ncbi:MAG: chloride channel protein [Desulfurococcales archaeon]|nr:chloride channel protein [Desulfurococcales archaeon]
MRLKNRLEKKFYDIAETLAYAEKWLILGAIIGVVSGLFILGFFYGLHYMVQLSASFIGVQEQIPPLEADLSAASVRGTFDPVKFYILIILGVAVSGVLVYKIAPEAEGHGTDAAVAAFHRRAALIPIKVPLVKAVASALAIGTGSSGGVEGPSVQMGAGLGSAVARLFRLTLHDRRIALTAGIAAALSAMFRAPIGSAFFAVEVLYKRDLEVQAFMPSIVASIVSFAVTAPFFQYTTLLPRIPISNEVLYTPKTILLILGLGVFTAPFSLLYVKSFKTAKNFFDKLVEEHGLSIYLKPVLGAILAGLLIVVWPLAAGSGRGVLAMTLNGEIINYIPFKDTLPLWIALLLAAVVKIIATSLSIGSGASGGVYAPALLSGALAGLAYYEIVQPQGLAPHLFAYIGMATFFGAAAKVPLATSIMVGEMGGDYLLIAPTLIASYIARELVGEDSIYESQIPRRLHEEAVTAEGMLALLKSSGKKPEVKVAEIIDRSYGSLPIDSKLEDVLELMVHEKGKIIPIVDDMGRVEGVLDPEDLEDIIEDLGGDLSVPVRAVKLRVPPIISMDATIEDALEKMVEHATDYVIVVDADGRYVGVVTLDDVSAAIAYLLASVICQKRKRCRQKQKKK